MAPALSAQKATALKALLIAIDDLNDWWSISLPNKFPQVPD